MPGPEFLSLYSAFLSQRLSNTPRYPGDSYGESLFWLFFDPGELWLAGCGLVYYLLPRLLHAWGRVVLTYLLTYTTADANTRLWLCRGVAATLLIALFGWLLAQLLGSVDLVLALKANETLLA